MFAHSGPYRGVSIPLQRVTQLRLRAQANPLLRHIGCVVSYTTAILDESIMQGVPGMESAMHYCLV